MSKIQIINNVISTKNASRIILSTHTDNFSMTPSSNDINFLSEYENSTEDIAIYIDKEPNQLVKNIISFNDLKYNWNSYGSNKVSLKCINRAIKTTNIFESKNISVLFAYPLHDGGVQLEIKNNKYSLEIEINPLGYEDHIVIFNEKDDVVFEKDEQQISISTIEEVIKKYSF